MATGYVKKYHVTSLPTRDNDFYPKDKRQQVLARMWREGSAGACLWERRRAQTGTAAEENRVEVPQKIKKGTAV